MKTFHAPTAAYPYVPVGMGAPRGYAQRPNCPFGSAPIWTGTSWQCESVGAGAHQTATSVRNVQSSFRRSMPFHRSRGKLLGLTAISPALGALSQSEAVDAGFSLPPAFIWTYRVLGIAGTALGGYHGYKRHENRKAPIWWALVWGFFGGVFPVVTIPIAFAQGFAKPKRRR